MEPDIAGHAILSSFRNLRNDHENHETAGF